MKQTRDRNKPKTATPVGADPSNPTTDSGAQPPSTWSQVRRFGGVLLVGIISSALWDFAAKPGLTRVPEILLSTLSFGSEWLADSTYRLAKIDPSYMLPQFVFALLPFVPIALATRHYSRTRHAISTQQAHTERASAAAMGPATFQQHIRNEAIRRQRSVRFATSTYRIAIATTIVLYIITSARYTLALNIRHKFELDLNKIAQHITPQQERIFRSRFAAFETATEFKTIKADIDKIATQHGIKTNTAFLIL